MHMNIQGSQGSQGSQENLHLKLTRPGGPKNDKGKLQQNSQTQNNNKTTTKDKVLVKQSSQKGMVVQNQGIDPATINKKTPCLGHLDTYKNPKQFVENVFLEARQNLEKDLKKINSKNYHNQRDDLGKKTDSITALLENEIKNLNAQMGLIENKLNIHLDPWKNTIEFISKEWKRIQIADCDLPLYDRPADLALRHLLSQYSEKGISKLDNNRLSSNQKDILEKAITPLIKKMGEINTAINDLDTVSHVTIHPLLQIKESVSELINLIAKTNKSLSGTSDLSVALGSLIKNFPRLPTRVVEVFNKLSQSYLNLIKEIDTSINNDPTLLVLLNNRDQLLKQLQDSELQITKNKEDYKIQEAQLTKKNEQVLQDSASKLEQEEARVTPFLELLSKADDAVIFWALSDENFNLLKQNRDESPSKAISTLRKSAEEVGFFEKFPGGFEG